MNEVLEIIRKRRSVRKYKQDAIPEKTLQDILLAGQYAPSGGNSQSSHLYVIKSRKVLEEIKELARGEFSKMQITEGMYRSIKNSIQASQKGNYDFTYNAPVLVVVTNQKDYGNAMADSSCVLENMMLAATSLFVGSCWINQLHWLDENPVIRSYMSRLGVTNQETICGGLALGFSDEGDRQPVNRTGNRITFIE